MWECEVHRTGKNVVKLKKSEDGMRSESIEGQLEVIYNGHDKAVSKSKSCPQPPFAPSELSFWKLSQPPAMSPPGSHPNSAWSKMKTSDGA
jgi:hypothetical protein